MGICGPDLVNSGATPYREVVEWEETHSTVRANLQAETKAELDEMAEKYLRQYPPQGYATFIKVQPRTEILGPPGQEHILWTLVFERYSSCE